jgi:endonuclease-8
VRLAARRMHAGLAGRRIVASQFRVPSLAAADLSGSVAREFAPYGKHMLLRTDTGLTLHTHFRMDGSWALLGPGKRLPRRLDDDVRVLLTTDEGTTAAGLRLPVVELLPTTEESRVLGHLGADVLGDDWPDGGEAEALRRLAADAERPVVEALLDQRAVAGIGNLWAVETLFLRGVSPWTPVGSVEGQPLLRLARRMMTYALTHPAQVTTGDSRRGRTHWVYGRAGQPCLRCGAPVQVRGATGRPYERETWWCPVCQPGPAPDLAARPWLPGLSGGRPGAQAGSRLARGGGRTGGPGRAR